MKPGLGTTEEMLPPRKSARPTHPWKVWGVDENEIIEHGHVCSDTTAWHLCAHAWEIRLWWGEISHSNIQLRGHWRAFKTCFSPLLSNFHFKFNKYEASSLGYFIFSRQICRNDFGLGKRSPDTYTHKQQKLPNIFIFILIPEAVSKSFSLPASPWIYQPCSSSCDAQIPDWPNTCLRTQDAAWVTWGDPRC